MQIPVEPNGKTHQLELGSPAMTNKNNITTMFVFSLILNNIQGFKNSFYFIVPKHSFLYNPVWNIS